MEYGLYHHYLEQFVIEALDNSDGTNAEISRYLWAKRIPRFLTRHRTVKLKALNEARKAFDEHRHWPLDIVISHMGLDRDILKRK